MELSRILWQTFFLIVSINALAQQTSLTIDNQTPGWLSSKISYGDQQNLSRLKITGYLNSDDISFLKRLSSEKVLEYLDIKNTHIVTGGNNNSIVEDDKLNLSFYEGFSLKKMIMSEYADYIFEYKDGPGSEIWNFSSIDTLVLTSHIKRYSVPYGFKSVVFFPEDTNWLYFGNNSIGTINIPSTLNRIGTYNNGGNYNLSCNNIISFHGDPESIIYELNSIKGNTLWVPVGTKEKYLNSKFKSMRVIVEMAPPEKVETSNHNLKIFIGDKTVLYSTITPANAFFKGLVWKSLNENVVTVNQSGAVEAVGFGKADIVVCSEKDENISDTCHVEVFDHTTGINLSTVNQTINIGEAITLSATTLPLGISDNEVTWGTSDKKVAMVEENGRVVAIGLGDCVITATTVDGGYTAECKITVVQPAKSLTLNKHETSIVVNNSETLKVTLKPDNTTDKTVLWSSNDTIVAVVNVHGVVTARKSGKAIITATAASNSEVKDSCEVTVIQPVEDITLNETSLIMTQLGEMVKLTATVLPEDASDKAVRWTSYNTSVCTVTENGTVIAVDYGTAIVVATTVDGGFAASCVVCVVHDAKTVEIDKHDVTMKAKDTMQLRANVLPDNAYDKTVTWTSSNDSLATVDADGIVKALAVGEVYIKATSSVNDEASDSCRVMIVKRIEVTDSTIVWNDTTFVYTGLSPQPTWKNTQEEYTVTAEMPELEKNVGRWEIEVPFTFTDGVDTLIVNYPLCYTIMPAELTIKVNDTERYHRDENPEFTFAYDGFVNDETEEVLTQKPIASTIATVESPVGTYPITAEGAEAENYAIKYVDGTLTVKERIVLTDSPIVWNDTTFVYTGLAPQPTWKNTKEEYTVTAEMPGLEKNVGRWETEVPFTFTDGVDTLVVNVPLCYTITPASLTIKANDAERYYGEENPEFTFTYEGFVNDETEEVLTQKPVATTTATADSPVGTYAIMVEGAEAENYAIEYVEGMLTVKEIPVEEGEDVTDVVTATEVTLKAGENTTLTVSLTTEDTDYNGYQFSLYLPEGISVATDENGKYLVTEKTDREIVALGVSDGSVLFYTTADKSHDALASGPLMEIELTADSVLTAGDYTIRIDRVVCATRENKSVSLPSSSVTVTVEKTAEAEVPAIVTAEDVEGLPAGMITLPVFLNNVTDINAFYFDLTLPKGITVAKDEGGNLLASFVGEYADGKMLLTVQPWDASMGITNNENTWRFIATPMADGVFHANAGHVMDIILSVDEDMVSGIYTARMNVVNLVEANGNVSGSRAGNRQGIQALRSPAAASWTSYSSITIKNLQQGDVNGDLVVDVADIASIISVMANGAANPFQQTADVNNDGVVDVADIATVISEMAARARRLEAMKE